MKDEHAPSIRPADPGGALMRMLQGRRLEGFEQSFKMSDARLLDYRYLLGIHKADVSPPDLFDLCARMGMPEIYLSDIREQAEAANAVHFGFEANGKGGIYKVYLEFASRLQAGRSDPVLLHLAYKWDCLDNRIGTIARYVCHPGLSLEGLLARLADAYSRRADTVASIAVRQILELAAGRTLESLMYLEVSEAGNPRASFDVNLHAADLRFGEIGAHLERMRAHYAIPTVRFGPLIERVRGARLGHLSGGINREGKDFLTLYYAAAEP